MTQMQNAMSWLAAQGKEHDSQSVTYRRGSDSVVLDATLARQLLRVSDGRGNTKIERADRDFLITAVDLILAGEVETPERGDRIEVSVGSVTEVFEVMPIDTEPAWRYSDSYRLRLRVHTKFVRTISADYWENDNEFWELATGNWEDYP